MKKALSLFLATLFILSTMSCLSVVSFGADVVVTEVEDNDTVSTAQEITVDDATTGTIDSTDDVDWYKFESNKDYFTVSLKPTFGATVDTNGHGWFLYLYDENFNLMKKTNDEWNTGYTNVSIAELPYSGTVYVKIVPYDNYLIDVYYDLKVVTVEDDHWESESNDTKSTANVINANETYVGSSNKSGDEDWYKFESDKNYFKLSLNPKDRDSSNLDKGWFLYIYDANNNEIKKYYESLNTGYTNICTAELAYTGTIYVKVVPYSDDLIDVTYNLKIETYENIYWENETNNDSTTANTINQDSIYKGTLMSTTDIDWFKITSTTDAFKVKLSVDLNESSSDSIGDGWKISVKPVDSSVSLAEVSATGEGTFSTRTLPYEKGKEYFVKVEAETKSAKSAPTDVIYNIIVEDASEGHKWEVENGGYDLDSATDVKIGETVYGNIYSAADEDYYKIIIPAEGKLKINFERDSSELANDGWRLVVQDYVGSEVDSVDLGNSKNATFTTETLKLGREYYIRMESVSDYDNKAPSPDIDYHLTFTYTMTAPKLSSVSNATNGVTIKWTKVEDCAGYYIYRKAGSGSWKKLTTVKGDTKVTYTDKSAKSGTKYSYKIKAYDGSTNSAFSSSKTITFLAIPTAKSVSTSKTGVTFTWAKVSGASGYEVYRATGSGSYKKIVTVKSGSTVKVVDKSAQKGKTYKYKVRAYKGDSTSAFSNVKTIKDKY